MGILQTRHQTLKLKDITHNIQYGYTTSASFDTEGSYKFLRITDIQNQGVNWDEVPFAEGLDNEDIANKYLLKEGDIVFARTGATTGKSYLITESKFPTVFASYLIRVSANESIISSKYLYFFFQSTMYWNQVEKNKKGAAQAGINASVLGQLDIPVIPIEEQLKAVEILEKAQQIINKRKAQINALSSLTHNLFLEMFGDPVGSKWDKKLLRNIADVRDGTHDSPKYLENGYPLITSKNIKNGEIDFDNVNNISKEDYIKINQRSKVDIGDIIMPMIGTIGNPVIVKTEPEFAIKNVALIKFNNPLLKNIYLKELLDSHYLEYILHTKKRGGTQKFLSLTDIRDIEVPLPPIALQEQYANKIELIGKQYKSFNKGLYLLEQNFYSLMQRAFIGKLTNN